MLEQILINGAVLSVTFALLAMGLALVYGVARLINLTHTAFYMIAAYLLYVLAGLWGFGLLPSAGLTIGLTTLIGMGTYRFVIDRIREHEIVVLIITVAMAVIFQELMIFLFGGTFLGLPAFVSGSTILLGVTVTNQRLLILVVSTVLIISTWTFIRRTDWGNAIRAVSLDTEVANLMGINVRKVYLITVGLATMLAAIAGVLVAPGILPIEPHMWMHPLIIVLAIVILGGLGSFEGSILASFILGYTETSVVFLFPGGAYLRTSVALLIMLAVLVLRPEGLFGVRFEEER